MRLTLVCVGVLLFCAVAMAEEVASYKVASGSVKVQREGQTIEVRAGDALLPGDKVTSSSNAALVSQYGRLELADKAVVELGEKGSLALISGEVRSLGSNEISWKGRKFLACGDALFNAAAQLTAAAVKGTLIASEEVRVGEGEKTETLIRYIGEGSFARLETETGFGEVKPIIEDKDLEKRVSALQEPVDKLPAAPPAGRGIARLAGGEGGSSVGRTGFDGSYKAGDIINVPAGSTQVITFPGGSATITGPAKVTLDIVMRDGKEIIAFRVDEGKIDITITEGDGALVIFDGLTAHARVGTLSCDRSGGRTSLTQSAGSTTVTPTDKVRGRGLVAASCPYLGNRILPALG